MESELGVKPRDTSGEEEREKGAGGGDCSCGERGLGSKLEIQGKRRRGEGGTGSVEREVWESNPKTRAERRRGKEGIAAAEKGSGVKPRDSSGIWEVTERV